MNYCYKMKSMMRKGSSQVFSPVQVREKGKKSYETAEEEAKSVHLSSYTETGSLKTSHGTEATARKLQEMNEKSSVIRQFYAKARRNKQQKRRTRTEVSNVVYKSRAEVNTQQFFQNASDGIATNTGSSCTTVAVHTDRTEGSSSRYSPEFGQRIDLTDEDIYDSCKPIIQARNKWKTSSNIAILDTSDDIGVYNDAFETSTQDLSRQHSDQRRKKFRTKRRSSSILKLRSRSEDAIRKDQSFNRRMNNLEQFGGPVNVGAYFGSSDSDDSDNTKREKFMKSRELQKRRRTSKKNPVFLDSDESEQLGPNKRSRTRMDIYHDQKMTATTPTANNHSVTNHRIENDKVINTRTKSPDMFSWLGSMTLDSTVLSTDSDSDSSPLPSASCRPQQNDSCQNNSKSGLLNGSRNNASDVGQLMKESVYETVGLVPAVDETSVIDENRHLDSVMNVNQNTECAYSVVSLEPLSEHCANSTPQADADSKPVSSLVTSKAEPNHTKNWINQVTTSEKARKAKFLSSLVDESSPENTMANAVMSTPRDVSRDKSAKNLRGLINECTKITVDETQSGQYFVDAKHSDAESCNIKKPCNTNLEFNLRNKDDTFSEKSLGDKKFPCDEDSDSTASSLEKIYQVTSFTTVDIDQPTHQKPLHENVLQYHSPSNGNDSTAIRTIATNGGSSSSSKTGLKTGQKKKSIWSSDYSWVDEYWKCSASSGEEGQQSRSSDDISVKDLSLLSASFPAMLWEGWTARNVRKAASWRNKGDNLPRVWPECKPGQYCEQRRDRAQ